MIFGARQMSASMRMVTVRRERPHEGVIVAEAHGIYEGAQSWGRACPLCSAFSDVDLLRYGEGVIDLDPKIAHCAFHPRVP
jgi:hypothetical protein